MILLDSNVWYAYFNREDHFHKKATEIINQAEMVVVPYCVAVEVATILTYRKSKESANVFLMRLVNSQSARLVENGYEQELFFFLHFKTKMSFTDYTLAYMSNQYGYKLVTFDKQLEQFAKKNKGKVVRLKE